MFWGWGEGSGEGPHSSQGPAAGPLGFELLGEI